MNSMSNWITLDGTADTLPLKIGETHLVKSDKGGLFLADYKGYKLTKDGYEVLWELHSYYDPDLVAWCCIPD